MTTATANARGVGRELGAFLPWRDLPPLPRGWSSLPSAFVHAARRYGPKVAIIDSTGASHSYGQTFLRALAMGRVLARTWSDAAHVGLLVPPVVAAAIANLAVTLWGKIPVNLNYTASQETVDS